LFADQQLTASQNQSFWKVGKMGGFSQLGCGGGKARKFHRGDMHVCLPFAVAFDSPIKRDDGTPVYE